MIDALILVGMLVAIYTTGLALEWWLDAPVQRGLLDPGVIGTSAGSIVPGGSECAAGSSISGGSGGDCAGGGDC